MHLFIISRSVVLRMRNVADKNFKENRNTYFNFNNLFFFENRAVYEIMLKNTVEPDKTQTTIWRMRSACWIRKVTITNTQYVILPAFHFSNGCNNTPWTYVIRKLLKNIFTAFCLSKHNNWTSWATVVRKPTLFSLFVSFILTNYRLFIFRS
jgi:hypothetical protein